MPTPSNTTATSSPTSSSSESQDSSTWFRYMMSHIGHENATKVFLEFSRTHFDNMTDEDFDQAYDLISRMLDVPSMQINAKDYEGNTALMNFVIGVLKTINDGERAIKATPAERINKKFLTNFIQSISLYEKIIKLLLSRGADVYLTNNLGLSPWNIAKFSYPDPICSIPGNDTLARMLSNSQPSLRDLFSLTNSVRAILPSIEFMADMLTPAGESEYTDSDSLSSPYSFTCTRPGR